MPANEASSLDSALEQLERTDPSSNTRAPESTERKNFEDVANFKHDELKRYLEHSKNHEKLQATNILIERAFKENKSTNVAEHGMGVRFTRETMQQGDPSKPEIFMTDRFEPKRLPTGGYETFVMIRMNNSAESSENTIILANVTVNDKGDIDLRQTPKLSKVLSEEEYFSRLESNPKSLDAKWYRGELAADEYMKKYKGFLGPSLHDTLRNRDKSLEGDPARWRTQREAENSHLLERMRTVYVETLENHRGDVESRVGQADSQAEQLTVKKVLKLQNLVGIYLREGNGEVDAETLEDLRRFYHFSEDDFKTVYEDVKRLLKNTERRANTASSQQQNSGANARPPQQNRPGGGPNNRSRNRS